MPARGPAAPSLRQFEHTEEIYKKTLLPPDAPRKGDFAEVMRSHCTSWETGLLVKVVDFPHWCKLSCADCFQHFFEWQVRVEPLNPTDPIAMKWESQAPGGPWLYPITWLKRWEIHRV
jgi:hypothetical protein